MNMDDKGRIVATADTLAGKPRITGTRIAVDLIVGRLADGWSFEQILESYPNITREDILAAQGFASQRKEAMSMSEIHFIVEESPEGGFVARAVGEDIFTEADDLAHLHAQVRDAVRCHFEEDKKPSVIRLHITREEALAA
jgi:uncharacterized protein (DUF433 family)